jgi:hypothetical protein
LQVVVAHLEVLVAVAVPAGIEVQYLANYQEQTLRLNLY